MCDHLPLRRSVDGSITAVRPHTASGPLLRERGEVASTQAVIQHRAESDTGITNDKAPVINARRLHQHQQQTPAGLPSRMPWAILLVSCSGVPALSHADTSAEERSAGERSRAPTSHPHSARCST